MKATKTTIVLAAAMSIFGTAAVQAQQNGCSRHEVSVNFQGLGIGSMPFKGQQTWNDQPGLSLGFSANYTYWFNKHIGFRTGLRMNRLSHNQKISNLDMPFSMQLPATSIGLPGGTAPTTVDFVAKATSVQEEWQYTFIELPLQLALQFSNVYFNVGVSLSKAIQATGNYSYENPSCAITALPDYGITMGTPVPVAIEPSSVTERDIKDRDMVKPFYFLLDAEVGYNFPIGTCTTLGVGLFGRLAPAGYKTKDAVDAYAINANNPPTYTLAQPSKSNLVEKVGYYEVGVSVGVNFGFRKKCKEGEEQASVLDPREEKLEAELAAMKAAREKTEAELAAMKAAREKAEAELEAMKAARDKAEAERQATDNKPAAAPAAAPQKGQQGAKAEAQKGVEALIATVYFDNAGTEAQFDEKTDAAIHAICEAMKADKSLKVTAYGHTDNTGGSETNMKYGQRRAEALKAYMVKLGAPAENIKCESKGEDEPVADNETMEGRAKNRRATVELK